MIQKHLRRLTLPLLLLTGLAAPQQILFVNATKTFKVPGNMENNASCLGHGVAMADINGDNRPDIYIANAVRYADKLAETLYISTADGLYKENDKDWHLEDSYGWTGSHGIVFFDYDNDGDYDVFNSTTDDRNRLYQNTGNGYYNDVTDAVGLPHFALTMSVFDSAHTYGYGTRGVVAFDANNDGWMDLYGVNWGPAEKRYPAPGRTEGSPIKTPPQPNEFYLNVNKSGKRGYQQVLYSGATPVNPGNMGTQGVTVLDVDEDGDLDIFVCHRNYVAVDQYGRIIGGPDFAKPVYNQLFINDGTEHFTENAAGAGLANYSYNDCNGTTFADYDNDGDYDAFVVPKSGKYGYMRVYRNRGNGVFDDVTSQLKLSVYGFSAALFDADNDGDLDLFAGRTRDYSYFYRNDNGAFTRVDNTGLRKKSNDPRGLGIGDVDNDGDLDLYYADANKEQIIVSSSYPDSIGNHLFINTTETSNRWLKITGRGPKGDMGGFGTKIWLYENGYMDDKAHLISYRQVINSYGYLCQDDPAQHFGLGQRDTVDVKVRLMDGTILRMVKVLKNQRIFFSRPEQIAKDSGDLQNGIAGIPLAQPLRVKVRDAYNKIVYGAAVNFTTTTVGGTITTPQPVYTNAEGVAEARYVPAAGFGEQKIRAACESSPGAFVEFTCSAPVVISYQISISSGNSQSGPVNEDLPSPIEIQVVDNNNSLVANIPVVFKVTAGNGKINGGDSVVVQTASNGRANAIWRLGSVYASAQKMRVCQQNERSKYVDFTATTWGGPAELKWLSALSFSGTVNKPLPDSLVAKIMDVEGHPVRNEYVHFTVEKGGGTINGAAAADILTNRDGVAKCRWRLGEKAGTFTNRLRAEASAPKGSPAIVQASAVAGSAAVLTKIAGDNQSALVNQTLDSLVVVAIADSFANPISGLLLTASVENPHGPISALAPATTNADGRAFFAWQLGTDPGLYRYKVHYGTLTPVVFNEQALVQKTTVLKLLSGNEQTGRAGHRLEQPVIVKVVDEMDQPIKSTTVNFVVLNGGGSITPLEAFTDSLGQAKAYWTLGGDGEQRLRAYLLSQANMEVFFTAVIKPNNAPLLSCPGDTVIEESQLLRFAVQSFDPDGDSVSLTTAGMPAGAAFDTVSSIFSWQPTFQQAGYYQITFIANDGLGDSGITQRSMNIHVINMNMSPLIIQSLPADTLIHIAYYQTMNFSVQSMDPDGDSLHYVWTINGAFIATDSAIAILPTPAFSLPAILKVRIYDNEISIDRVWKLDIQTKVESADAFVDSYSLEQNYPNPFNPTTRIRFSVLVAGTVRLRIFNTSGQLIRILSDQWYGAGKHDTYWDGMDQNGRLVPSGVYYCVMETGTVKYLKKMLLVK